MDENDPRLRQLVERVDLFRGLSTSDVAKIFARGRTEIVPKGETIFFQGTTGSTMYVVLGGTVGVFDGKQQLNALHVGDTFGEMSLLCQEPRSATIVALENSRVFVLDETLFNKILTKRVAVQVLLNIGRMMSKRLVQANKALKAAKGD